MNKGDLAVAVAERTGLSKVSATHAVESVFQVISEALRQGEEVRILGFGTFAVGERAGGSGRHPQTGEPIDIPASRQPKFKPGQGLKTAVNGW